METKEYLIREMSEVLSVSTDTLRFYEKKGILTPKRRENGYRYYTEDDIKNFMWILYNRKLNFSLEEISGWIGQDSTDFSDQFGGNICQKIKEEQNIMRDHALILTRLEQTLNDFEAVNAHLNQFSLKDYPSAYILKTCPDYMTALEEWYKASSCVPGLDMAYSYTHYKLTGNQILPLETELLLYDAMEQSVDSSFSLNGLPKTAPVPCVYTTVKTESSELTRDLFYNMETWASNQGIKTEAHASSNIVMHRDGDFSPFYYYELYIPIISISGTGGTNMS